MDARAGSGSSAGGRGRARLAGNLGIRVVFGIVSTLLFSLGMGVAASAALPPVSVSQVKDIRPGPDDGSPFMSGNGNEQVGGVNLNGRLIFDAQGPEGVEPWQSDGTGPGTGLIKEIADGAIFSSLPKWLTVMNGEVFFSADEVGPVSEALWKTDGTEAGTVMVKDVNPIAFDSGAASNLTNVGGTLFFLADSDSANGAELWKSDGTTDGTVMVKDIESTLSPGPATNFTAVGDRLFFTFDDGVNGKELWTSDGSEAGTKMVENIGPGATSGLPGLVTRRVEDFIAYNGSLYFRADDGVAGLELWRSDGTEAGTYMVKDINDNASDSMGFTAWFAKLNGELFFATNFEFFKTDGTDEGTVEVKNLIPNPVDSMVKVGDNLYFRDGNSLYKSDGSEAGTEEVEDLGAQPDELTDFNGTLYFALDDGVNGRELWRSDGEPGGAERLTDINSGPGGSLINRLTVAGNYLYFRGDDDGATGIELWAAFTDVDPPETTIDSGPGEGETIGTDTATFTFSSDEPGSTFSCVLDAGPPEACDSGTKTYTGLSEGAHTFSVAATDPAPSSNADPTPATRSFSYAEPDTIAPETTIDSGPGEGETIGTDTATFTFSSDEPGSTFSCVLDAGPPEACDSGTKTYTGLSEGAHTFSVTATDPAPFRNVDPTPATRGFTFAAPDTIGPNLKLTGRKRQSSKKRIVVKAACVDEACALRATGRIRVKILRAGGKVKKTRNLKLRPATASRGAGNAVKLKLRLKGRAKKLVKRAFGRKTSRAKIRVRATDQAGNASTRNRIVKVVKKTRKR